MPLLFESKLLEDYIKEKTKVSEPSVIRKEDYYASNEMCVQFSSNDLISEQNPLGIESKRINMWELMDFIYSKIEYQETEAQPTVELELTLTKTAEELSLEIVNNFSDGGSGYLLISKNPVEIACGDNYISSGFAGKNVFQFTGEKQYLYGTTKVKVYAVTPDLKWNRSGNNSLNELPKISLEKMEACVKNGSLDF